MPSAQASNIRWSYFAVLCAGAFILNWIWEMAQMPGYVEMAGRPWRETLGVCTRATFGDVLFTLAIYAVGALATRRLEWGMTPRWNVYATASLLGAATAAAIEWRALAVGRWSYTDTMPIVPLLKVGLWPFLQLLLLVPAAFFIAAWWTNRLALLDVKGRGSNRSSDHALKQSDPAKVISE